MKDLVAMDIKGFSDILHEFNIYDKELVKEFECMIRAKDSPNCYFDFINHGAFKECYRLTPNFIIKFNASDNPTIRENQVLANAQQIGISKIFLPTRFYELKSCTLPLKYLDDDPNCSSALYDSYYHTMKTNPDFTPILFDSFFIQPFAKISRDINREEDYSNSSLVDENGDIIPDDSINFTSRSWLKDVLTMYGREFFDTMINFFEEEGIYDLHRGNIGYLNEKPVIIDWLSEKD